MKSRWRTCHIYIIKVCKRILLKFNICEISALWNDLYIINDSKFAIFLQYKTQNLRILAFFIKTKSKPEIFLLQFLANYVPANLTFFNLLPPYCLIKFSIACMSGTHIFPWLSSYLVKILAKKKKTNKRGLKNLSRKLNTLITRWYKERQGHCYWLGALGFSFG